MKAETTRRPLLPACASASRTLALSTLATVAPDAVVGVGHDQLETAQPAAGKLAHEGGPERLRLGGSNVHAENFALAVAVDADRDDHRDGDDAAILAHLHIGGVDPQIGLRSRGRERPSPGRRSRGQSRLTWLLEMPLMPIACSRSLTERVEPPAHRLPAPRR